MEHMDFSSKILAQYRKDANYTLAFILRIAALLMSIIMLLQYLNVFILADIIYPIISFSIFTTLLPTLFYNILHIHTEPLKYFFLTMIVFMCSLMYAILSYHVIIMLVFPILVSCLYCEKKSTIYTCIISYPAIIFAHLGASYLHLVPDEPLVELYDVIAYGITPRLIEFTIMVVISISMTDKIQKLISKLAKQNNELYENQQTVIQSLTEMVESQSQETGQHVKRVGEYTKVLCRALGMDDDEVWMVGTAAMMHDIGKMMIPSEIIEKPGKLTDEEFEIVKQHVVYGKKLLGNCKGELLKVSAQIAYEHHEKYNGKGYLGKKGNEISLYARCVAIADVFDALVSKRPYKEPWDPLVAKAEIISQRGEHFDPFLTDLFEEHFDEFLEVFNKYPDTINGAC